MNEFMPSGHRAQASVEQQFIDAARPQRSLNGKRRDKHSLLLSS